MKTEWALQDAKNQFSAVVEQALRQGPQWVTRRGREAVVVVAAREYRKMKQPKQSLVDFFRKSPLRGVELEIPRSREPGRDTRL